MRIDPLNFFDVLPSDITEMYTAIGRALWFCQCFEESLAYHLCLFFEIPRGTAEVIAAKILADKRRKTMGQLVREMTKKKSPTIPESLEVRLNRFTDDRNWLAHRIQQENHIDLYNRDRFSCLLSRLDTIKREAQALNKVFEAMLDDWYRMQGLSQEELQRRMVQTIREWQTIKPEGGNVCK
jgi:uncharacterized protein YdhG (YjbR/CyaY superfamily)